MDASSSWWPLACRGSARAYSQRPMRRTVRGVWLMRDQSPKVVRRVLLPSYGTRSRWRYKTRDCLAALLFIRGRTHFPWHGPIIPRTQLLLAAEGTGWNEWTHGRLGRCWLASWVCVMWQVWLVLFLPCAGCCRTECCRTMLSWHAWVPTLLPLGQCFTGVLHTW